MDFSISLAAFFVVERRVAQPMLDFRLFIDRLFAYALAARYLNSLARDVVLFILIFFLQGPYGLDPLSARIMMAPFGAAPSCLNHGETEVSSLKIDQQCFLKIVSKIVLKLEK